MAPQLDELDKSLENTEGLRVHVIEKKVPVELDGMDKFINIGVWFLFIIGGVIYYLVVVIVLWLRLNSNDLKLFTAVIVALFLAVPYLREQSVTSFAKFRKKGGRKDA